MLSVTMIRTRVDIEIQAADGLDHGAVVGLVAETEAKMQDVTGTVSGAEAVAMARERMIEEGGVGAASGILRRDIGAGAVTTSERKMIDDLLAWIEQAHHCQVGSL